MIRILRPHKEKVSQGRNQDFLEMRLTRDGSNGWCEWCSLSSSEFYEFIFRSCRICMINDHFLCDHSLPTLLESIITRHFEMGIVTKRAYFLYFLLVYEFLECRWFFLFYYANVSTGKSKLFFSQTCSNTSRTELITSSIRIRITRRALPRLAVLSFFARDHVWCWLTSGSNSSTRSKGVSREQLIFGFRYRFSNYS